MEEDGEDLTPFWLQSSTNRRRRRSPSSFFLSSGALIFLLCVTAFLFMFFIIPSILSFTTQIFRPNLVKKSWDSINIVLVLFALVFGFLSRNKNYDEDHHQDHQTVSSNVRNEVQKSDSSTVDRWYEYSDHRTVYDSSGVGGLRRTSRATHPIPLPFLLHTSSLHTLSLSLSLSLSTMSYVPPHLRNSIATKTTTTSSTTTLEHSTTTPTTSDHYHKFNSNSSTANGNVNNYSTSSFSNAARRSSVPDHVLPHWKPSERVLRLTPEQIEEVRLRLNVDVDVASESSPAPAPIESFTDMCLHPSIMKDIAFHEYSTPTSIQAQAMPVALSGRDLMGCAETGSGKTAAFTIPMIQHCLVQPPIHRGDGPLALVLAPTRELAQQIEKEVKAFSRSLESFRTAIVVGGTNIAEQRSELRAGVNIVVATPGRFIDHLQQGNTSLSRVSFVVLDEADRMLDMGFEPQIREVMWNLPEKHQTLLFSATMPTEIEALAQEYLTNPVRVKVGKVSSPTANVAQILVKVSENEKLDQLLTLLVEESTQAERSGHPLPLTIVFVERKTRCDEVAEALIAQGLHAVVLHGGRSQSEREAALRDFRVGSTNILVATDVASRGLDVTGVAHVVNLDLPKTMEDYVHRIGRTGRAGSTGQATSFCTDRDMFLVAQIKKAIADVESGNTVAFATGKVARRKEREAAAAQKEARTALSKLSLVGPTSINVEDKYRYMIAPSMIKTEGAADGAWDD